MTEDSKKIMTEDSKKKIMDYLQFKNLNYQNQLTYYIYRNTFNLTQMNRKVNFWRIADFIIFVLAFLALVFFNLNWSEAVLITLLSIIPLFFFGILWYNSSITKKNNLDQNIIALNTNLNGLKDSCMEYKVLDEFKIPENKVIEKDSKNNIIDHIKYYLSILLDVCEQIDFKNISVEKRIKILDLASTNIKIFESKLQKLKKFMEDNVNNADPLSKRLNDLIGVFNKQF